MKNNKRFSIIHRHQLLIPIIIEILIMIVVSYISYNKDLKYSEKMMVATADYITKQCNRYTKAQFAAETKSLMRVIQSCKHITHEMEENPDYDSISSLKNYSSRNYLSGIVLLDQDGNIQSQFHKPNTYPDKLKEVLTSSDLISPAKYPNKVYAARFLAKDNSEVDIASVQCKNNNGTFIAYYHTPAEYKKSFNLAIDSLLEGYSLENNGTIAIAKSDRIIACNNKSFVGQGITKVSILEKLSKNKTSNMMVHSTKNNRLISQYYGVMKKSRDYYVYVFWTDHKVFINTSKTLLYTFIICIGILCIIIAVIWQTEKKAQESNLLFQREYAKKLNEKNEELSNAVNQAAQANAAKTSFLSRMSHDIRTPLNGIIGLLEIDEAHSNDIELIKANQKKMRVAANHLLSLINDVLQMSKLESGETIIAHEPLDLKELSKDIIAIISQRATDAGISMEYDKNSDYVEANYVYGSPLHLRQIFINIYTNCIKYNKENGKIFTNLKCIYKTEKMVTYQWTISDTGIGMSQEFLKHIFDPFTQEHNDARSIYQGTGLGMSIVQKLVTKMSGTIQVSSKEGQGSNFVITIPFEIAPTPTEPQPSNRAADSTKLKGIKFLLAEDNALNAEIAKILLEDQEAEVTIVSDGKQALDTFTSCPPQTFDAILMDIMMPVMNGLEATMAIRALNRPDAKTIPIIAMTANAFTEDAQKCIDAGMNIHLSKPLEMEKVKLAITKLLEQKAGKK